MADPINIGKTLWTLPDTISWNREKGEIVTHNYQGTQSEIENLKDLLKTDAYVENIQVTGGATWKLSYTRTALDNSNQQADDNEAVANAVWELSPEQIDNDIKSAVDLIPLKEHFAEIDFVFENGNKITKDKNGGDIDEIDISKYCADNSITAPDYWDTRFPNLKAGLYYQFKAHGVTSYPLFRWVIRQTITINKRSKLTIHGEGFDNKPLVVDSTAIPLPNDINFTVPSGYVWLVIPPQLNKQGNKKTIVYEWRGAQTYSPTLYNGGNKEVWQ